MAEPGPSSSVLSEQTGFDNDYKSCTDFLRKFVSSPRSGNGVFRSIVQELINGVIKPEMFQQMINGNSAIHINCEDQLISKFKKTLPVIRHLLFCNKLKIKGIVAPPVQVFKQHKYSCGSCEVELPLLKSCFKTDQHEKQILKTIGTFMNSEEFSDINVRVGKKVFKCHKIILAASSSYFRALFSSGMREVQEGIVELTALEEKEFRNILKFMYTGKSNLNKKNVLELLFTSSYLQISFLEKDCIQFIENNIGGFSDTDHFELLKLSNSLNLTEITSRLLYWVSYNFQDVRTLDLFKETLTYKNLIELLNFPLNVSSEEEICDSLLSWIAFDVDNRRQYCKRLISKLQYLTLTEKYMKDVFLCHPVVRNNAELESVISECLEYMASPGRQWEYIEDVSASHRVGHKYVDVLAVCYPTSIQFTALSRIDDGSEYTGKYRMLRESRNDKLKNLKRRPESIAACNLSRSEIVLSTGTQLFYFNGETCTWSRGLLHSAPSQHNCLLYDPDLHAVYSVVVGTEKILIEKCTAHCESIEVLYSENTRMEIVQNRTCAYLIGENIYMIKPFANNSEKTTASIYRFNTVTKTLEIVENTELLYSFSAAVTYKNIVFIVDKKGKNIFRVSDNGIHIERHGTIDLDYTKCIGEDFGACIYNGRLVMVRGRKTKFPHFLKYDLDTHRTEIIGLESKEDAAVCLKMTICLGRG